MISSETFENKRGSIRVNPINLLETMKSKLLIIAITSLTGFALAADGDKKGEKPNPAKRAEMILKNSDTDGNGTLSKTEMANSKMGKKMTEKRGADAVDKMFTRLDKDKDGELSKGELTSMSRGKGKGKGKKPDAKKEDAK